MDAMHDLIANFCPHRDSDFLAIARGYDVEKSVDVIKTRVKLIKLINEYLTTHSKGVDDEAIAAVMALAYNEVGFGNTLVALASSWRAVVVDLYAERKSVLAHMKGLREMLRT
ncbi:hypothetical protein D0Z07_1522 [Hyphodiscus hymeniophilus]|uniref:Uncharacterized protein n=1 Tax=Hyphodiscus hymeniophilus TaxID=353542 RepID=A0A9P6VNE3_9HELO|nr:hypothetical protein D0Z07_1522 [Hyphodiscus hymeniophilus]